MTAPERFEEILDLFAAMWGEAMQHGEVSGIASIRFIYEDDKKQSKVWDLIDKIELEDDDDALAELSRLVRENNDSVDRFREYERDKLRRSIQDRWRW